MALLAVLLACTGAAALATEAPAAEGEGAKAGEVVDYAKLLAPDRSGEGVIARTRRETTTYPYIERAQRLIAQGNLPEARKDLDVYLERDPDDLSARFTYGVLASSLGDSHAAVQAMTKVLEGRPGFGPALLYRAVARQKDGDDAGALADYQAAAKSDVLTRADRAEALDSVAQVAVNLHQNDVAPRRSTRSRRSP
ncbi:MAG: hypothetical protein FJ144_13635 [Deltaproteobacteria bacterium]|nr:hypothetical protein [Deltaproteobacteria bacterium]